MTSRRLPVMEDCGCSRRELMKGLGVAAVGALLLEGCMQNGSTLSSATTSTCGTGHCISLDDPANKDLTTPGGAMVIDTPTDTIMVIRSTETEVIALSAICTHAGCSMDYLPSVQLLDCPCHGSQFSTEGAVTRGPARRPLRAYTATIANNTITVT